ncbi:MAG: 50S ribosomal protein L23 [Gammaproteobacteria bacterium]|nr:50S ribosomal protein L23 [Gammaproteobacteria bacterium]
MTNLNPRIVLRQLINTEKSQQQAGTYVFEVERDATKHTVKSAVENLFNVKVQSVRTCIQHNVVRHPGQRHTSSRLTKKAYVTLHADQEISLDGLIS